MIETWTTASGSIVKHVPTDAELAVFNSDDLYYSGVTGDDPVYSEVRYDADRNQDLLLHDAAWDYISTHLNGHDYQPRAGLTFLYCTHCGRGTEAPVTGANDTELL